MPGILPMKVIKVGTSSQSRIAQACDRCRSKKIRCDGIRPCCSQCANVGFECRTSDKLSRRAFPRGYTESLEERVRQLEAETRELKDLLDEKDEKLDMLSKMHGAAARRPSHAATGAAATPNNSNGQRRLSISPSPTNASRASSNTSSDCLSRQSLATASTATTASSSLPQPTSAAGSGSGSASAAVKGFSPRSPADPAGLKSDASVSASASVSAVPSAPAQNQNEDTFRVQAAPLVLGVENSDSYFMGPSSGRSFIDVFKRRMQESGKPCADFHTEAFLHIQGCYPLVDKVPGPALRVPPRLFSDRCVNVYFQEWSPLFPTLHRPAFLQVYDEFVSDADKIKSHHKLAQLYLVFAIAGLSGDQPDREQVAACELQWQRSLDAVLMDNTIITLQCLVLAILYCAMRADYRRLLYYKGVAVGLAQRLGLHQSQKRFSFGALTIETRKKVFWTLYVLDCFSAAVLGLPKQLKDADIYAEFPTDTDDEYVTEKGFQPTLPGESTRLSAALALFRAARVLAKVLDTNYPTAASHELSLQRMAALDAELQAWRDALPPHLSLAFRQEKPAADVTGNRSPLLSLTYYYIRTLIWRPAVGSSLGIRAAPAVMAISEASKHMVQIIALLDERKMAFSLCLNMPDLLILCGMTLLYQSLFLKQDSKMMKDTERLVNVVVQIADRCEAPGSYDFRRVASLLVPITDAGQPRPPSSSVSRTSPVLGQPAAESSLLSGSGSSSASSSSSSSTAKAGASAGGASSTPTPTPMPAPVRRASSSSASQRHHQRQKQQQQLQQHLQQQQRLLQQKKKNLDYMSMSPQPVPAAQPRLSQQQQQQQQQQQYFASNPQKTASPSAGGVAGVTTTSWEALLSSMDGGHMNVYDAIYGGAPNLALSVATDTTGSVSAPSQSGDGWSPESWGLTGYVMGDLAGAGSGHHGGAGGGGGGGGGGGNGHGHHPPPPAQSVMSFSDESMSSVAGDDMAPADVGNLGLGGLDANSLPFRSSSGGLLNHGCSTGAGEYGGDNMMESSFL